MQIVKTRHHINWFRRLEDGESKKQTYLHNRYVCNYMNPENDTYTFFGFFLFCRNIKQKVIYSFIPLKISLMQNFRTYVCKDFTPTGVQKSAKKSPKALNFWSLRKVVYHKEQNKVITSDLCSLISVPLSGVSYVLNYCWKEIGYNVYWGLEWEVIIWVSK